MCGESARGLRLRVLLGGRSMALFMSRGPQHVFGCTFGVCVCVTLHVFGCTFGVCVCVTLHVFVCTYSVFANDDIEYSVADVEAIAVA
jgi:hypothetical protein